MIMEDKISEKDFAPIGEYIETISGVNLKYEKEYLVRQRLTPILLRNGFDSFSIFARHVLSNKNNTFNADVISAICTHETSFFRDEHFFTALARHVFTEFSVQNSEQPVKIWSAAASTGQEIYSLAILIDEFVHSHPYAGLQFKDFRIFGTDIDGKVLKKTADGIYTEAEVSRGLSSGRLSKYFTPIQDGWYVNPKLRDIVILNRLSLHDFSLSDITEAPFDIILLRNVLIYFREDTTRNIISAIHSLMKSGGYLLLGSSENLYKISDLFESIAFENSILYRKKDST